MKSLMAQRAFQKTVFDSLTLVGLIALLFPGVGCRKAAVSPTEERRDAQAKEPKKPSPAPEPSDLPLETGAPAQVSAEDLKKTLEGLPSGLRQNQSDVELALIVGIRAWAIEYTGGPIRCWLEVEETGQQTTPARLPAKDEKDDWSWSGEQGRILLWFRPGATSNNPSLRSQRIVKDLKDRGVAMSQFGGTLAPIAEAFAVFSYKDVNAKPVVPRWWSTWYDVSLKELSRTTKVEGSEPVTLLAVEATEQQPPLGANRRKVKLTLRARLVESKAAVK